MADNTNKAGAACDKRDFFRISQDVIFDHKVVDSFAAKNDAAEHAFADAASLTLVNELRRLDRDNAQTLRLLTEKNRLLGDYLHNLSNKIDLLVRHTLLAEERLDAKRPTTRINLSEDGLAFVSERMIYKGSYLAVRLIFLPSYSPVISFAKVLRCEQRDERYQVAAKFYRLPTGERQELSRQILRAQVNKRGHTPKPTS